VAVSGEAGATFVVDGQSVSVTGAGEQLVKLDLVKKLAQVKLAELEAAKLRVPVQVKFSDGLALSAELELAGTSIRSYLRDELEKAKTGKVVFPGEDQAPAKPRVLAMVGGDTVDFYGDGAGLQSIDLVAFIDVSSREGSCGSYQNSRTGEIVSVGMTMFDDNFTVVDRRSGQVRSRRTIRAPTPACPTSMSASSSVSSSASGEEGERYLKSLVGG
jgi:hypothetical protein